jgi:CubicO group peptidase (beta-lactamase class C family)
LRVQEGLDSTYLEEDVAYPSGGHGLVSTTHDYARFCLMLSGGGQLDGVRILSSKTLAYMTQNHLPDGKDMGLMTKQLGYTEVEGAGAGFGLGFSVVENTASYGTVSSVGSYAWGGAAATVFWLDPAGASFVILAKQPSR